MFLGGVRGGGGVQNFWMIPRGERHAGTAKPLKLFISAWATKNGVHFENFISKVTNMKLRSVSRAPKPPTFGTTFTPADIQRELQRIAVCQQVADSCVVSPSTAKSVRCSPKFVNRRKTETLSWNPNQNGDIVWTGTTELRNKKVLKMTAPSYRVQRRLRAVVPKNTYFWNDL